MAEVLCGICEAQPKKYKCPTCSIPYCSLPCFKKHTTTHDRPSATLSIAASEKYAPEIPQPPPPAPLPKYLKQKVDFSVLAANPKFQELLRTHQSLLPILQRVYAATIEPDPEDQPRYGDYRRGARGRGYGRGHGNRGRGRGNRFSEPETPRKWTEKKGHADALRMLKGLREGKRGDEEKEAMAEFVKLVEETFGEKIEEETNRQGDVMNTT